ncbi:MAG: hypothetical protein FWE19_03835 [Oscillospiraceae bacterium]|nr:hypothetical protein [Oscillospiraceae bacterium]
MKEGNLLIKAKKLRLVIISLLMASAISVLIWFGYNELTRPTSPVIAIDGNVVWWTATGTGDMTAGRFIRSYEMRIVLGGETFTEFIDGPTGRTIRTPSTSTRFSRWSNTVNWIRAE